MATTPAAFHDAFSDVASAYAQSRPPYPAALFQALAALSPARDRAWDCGTGNGQAALALAAHFQHVVATDASPEQIAQAVPHPRVQYTVTVSENTRLPDDSVDLISVAQAVHWFERRAFYAEVRRVARPQALIALYGYDWFYLSPALDALTETCLLQPIDGYWSATHQLLWDGYRTLHFPFEELPRLHLAIHLHWTLDQLFDHYLSWSAPRRKIDIEGDGFLREARARFASAWGDPSSARPVVMPLHVRLGRVP